MLEIINLRKSFGGLSIFNELNLNISAGEIRSIIGPNGAGKTTLFNLITGQLRPDSGSILFNSQNIVKLKTHDINRMGISRKFQAPSVFEEMTVWDNLAVAGSGHSPVHKLFTIRSNEQIDEKVVRTLASVRLTDQRNMLAGNLSHGQKQWLEIGIVLLNDPKLILLDEPTAGMSMSETAETADLILEVFQDRTAIIIEHDIGFVRRLNGPVAVLYRGEVMCEGTFDEVAANESVRRVYLGEEV